MLVLSCTDGGEKERQAVYTFCVIWKREKNIILFNARVYPAKKWIDIRVSLFPLSWMIDDKHLRFLPFRLICFPFLPNDSWMMHAELQSHYVIRYFFCFFVEEYVQF